MSYLILAGAAAGALYLLLLLAVSACVCVFAKLCIFYLRSKIKPPENKVGREPSAPKTETPSAAKKKTARKSVNKIFIDPQKINRIYVRGDEKAK